MKMMPFPAALSDWISERTLRCSGTPRAAVGSSMMTRRASRRLRGRSRPPVADRPKGGDRGVEPRDVEIRGSRSSPCAAVAILARSRTGRSQTAVSGSRPRKMFRRSTDCRRAPDPGRSVSMPLSRASRSGEMTLPPSSSDVAIVGLEHAGNRLDRAWTCQPRCRRRKRRLRPEAVERYLVQRLDGAESFETSRTDEDRSELTQLAVLQSVDVASDRRAPRR